MADDKKDDKKSVFRQSLEDSASFLTHAAFPSLGLFMDKWYEEHKKEKDENAESSGRNRSSKDFNNNAVAVIDAGFNEIHNDLSKTNIILSTHLEQQEKTNLLLEKMLVGGFGGGRGNGGGGGGGNSFWDDAEAFGGYEIGKKLLGDITKGGAKGLIGQFFGGIVDSFKQVGIPLGAFYGGAYLEKNVIDKSGKIDDWFNQHIPGSSVIDNGLSHFGNIGRSYKEQKELHQHLSDLDEKKTLTEKDQKLSSSIEEQTKILKEIAEEIKKGHEKGADVTKLEIMQNEKGKELLNSELQKTQNEQRLNELNKALEVQNKPNSNPNLSSSSPMVQRSATQNAVPAVDPNGYPGVTPAEGGIQRFIKKGEEMIKGRIHGHSTIEEHSHSKGGESTLPEPNMKHMPRNLRNNNPGNIIDGKWAREQPGYKGSDGHFAKFDNMDDGYKAANKNLDSYASKGFKTPRQILSRWAPSGSGEGNDPEAYAKRVEKLTGLDPDKPLGSDPDSRAKMLKGITEVEGGVNSPYTNDQISNSLSGKGVINKDINSNSEASQPLYNNKNVSSEKTKLLSSQDDNSKYPDWMDERSRRELSAVNSDLAKNLIDAANKSGVHFSVTQGMRSQEEANHNAMTGRGVRDSQHLYGAAVDLKIDGGREEYARLGKAYEEIGKERGQPARWLGGVGGRWANDYVHYDQGVGYGQTHARHPYGNMVPNADDIKKSNEEIYNSPQNPFRRRTPYDPLSSISSKDHEIKKDVTPFGSLLLSKNNPSDNNDKATRDMRVALQAHAFDVDTQAASTIHNFGIDKLKNQYAANRGNSGVNNNSINNLYTDKGKHEHDTSKPGKTDAGKASPSHDRIKKLFTSYGGNGDGWV